MYPVETEKPTKGGIAMKGNSVVRPEIMVKSEGKTQVIYNVVEVTKEDMEGNSVVSFDYDYAEVVGEVTRGKIISSIISQTYSKEDELALINDELLSPSTKEYREYQSLRTFAKDTAAIMGFLSVSESTPEDLFDPMKAKADLLNMFQAKMVELAPYWGVISDLIGAKNFSGLNLYTGGLLQAGIIVQDDISVFNQTFLTQSIDLTKVV